MIHISAYIDANPRAGQNLWAAITSYRYVRKKMGKKVKLSCLHALVITCYEECRFMAMVREKGGLQYMISETSTKVSYLSIYGNNDDPSYNGDAWLFRGFGWCQLTFADNFERCFRRMVDLGIPTLGCNDVRTFMRKLNSLWGSADMSRRQQALVAGCILCACHVADAENGVEFLAAVTGRGARGSKILDQRRLTIYD